MTGPGSFALDGRRAVVTGGAGGLGTAMTAALTEAGATVAVIGRSGATDPAVHSIRADLADRDSLADAFARACSVLGGVDVLVTAHGHTHPSPALEHDVGEWDQTLETNLTSVFLLARLAAQDMLDRRRGKIITVASMLSFSGGLGVAAYAASKGGVAQLTKALANEWAAYGINVNAIAPGYIRTGLNRHIWGDPQRAAQILSRLPSGRWGEPDDLKGATVFLASAASDYLHGVVLPVDGGYLAR